MSNDETYWHFYLLKKKTHNFYFGWVRGPWYKIWDSNSAIQFPASAKHHVMLTLGQVNFIYIRVASS